MCDDDLLGLSNLAYGASPSSTTRMVARRYAVSGIAVSRLVQVTLGSAPAQ